MSRCMNRSAGSPRQGANSRRSFCVRSHGELCIFPGMADEDGVEVEVEAAVRHRYRICEVVPRDKKGRPKRNEIMGWDDLSDEDVKRLRELNEPRLKPRQVAELDGRTVARGEGVLQGEVEETEPVQDPASVRADNPAEFIEFVRRAAWDVYQRDAEASQALREQVHELNRQALAQGKQILEILDQLRAQALRQPPAAQPQGRPMTLDDISKLIEVGANAVSEIIRPGS